MNATCSTQRVRRNKIARPNLLHHKRIGLSIVFALFAFLLTLGSSPSLFAVAPTISATKTVDKSTANPGDTLNYTVIVTDSVADATNVQFTDTLSNTLTLVGGSVASSPVAVNDTYSQTLVGNVSINSANIGYSVTTNDFLGSNPTATISAY